ncbi:MAG: thioesterase [Candidatus Thermoplasmatota archaeon]|nr:thioesterase [Candidatus Thermoplasmatota archaeon]
MLVKEYQFKVKTYHCAPHGYLNLHSMMQHMQEAASIHAEEMGFGEQWMIENSCIWVLADLHAGIDHLPTWKEDVTLYTWPSGNDTLKAYREFLAQGSDGRELFRASSSWMVLSMLNKMPVMMRDVMKNTPYRSKRNFPDMSRLKASDKGISIMDIIVPYHSIDSNGHVNNTEYVKWAIDGARKAEMIIPKIRSFHISFMAEVFEGQELELFNTDMEDGKNMISIGRKDDKKNVFLMEIGV